MKSPATPVCELDRLTALRALEVLDTPAEERFDRVTRLARRLFRVPIALVSLVDSERQWFKSSDGLGVAETPRDISFCGHAILADEPFVITDAHLDARFADNPLVTGAPHIRFYAGCPVRSPEGHRVGTLCIIDRVPRAMSSDDLDLLRDLACMIERELATRRLSHAQSRLLERLDNAELRASVDGLTRVWNRATALGLLEQELRDAAGEGTPVSVALLDLDHFKSVNDTYGHLVGDEVLRTAAERIRRGTRPEDVVGRYGGEEFVLVVSGCSPREAEVVCDRVRRRLASEPVATQAGELRVTASLGVVTTTRPGAVDAMALLALADEALYTAKARGRNRVESCTDGEPMEAHHAS